MKNTLSLLSLFLASNSFAGVPAVKKCVSQYFPRDHLAPACAGVETDSDVATVKRCVDQLAGSYDSFAAACAGVKTDTDIVEVKKCAHQFFLHTDFAPACAGVKTDSDVAAVKKCVYQFVLYPDAVAGAACRGVK